MHCKRGADRHVMATRGFSLLELLVALVIAALLMGVAWPAYREQLLGARRSLARAELLAVQARQAQFFIDHKRYADDLSELGLPAATYGLDADSNRLPSGAPARVYLIGMLREGDGYTLYARPQGSQRADERCAELSLDHLGMKSLSGHGSVAQCW